MVHSKELKISSEITVEIRLILYTLGLRLYVVPFAIKVFLRCENVMLKGENCYIIKEFFYVNF